MSAVLNNDRQERLMRLKEEVVAALLEPPEDLMKKLKSIPAQFTKDGFRVRESITTWTESKEKTPSHTNKRFLRK